MSGRGAFLCADIGTSSIKAAFIALDGALLASSRIPYEVYTDSSLPAQAWESAFFRACGRLLKKAPGTEVLAVSVSGNGPSLVPLDQKGQALAPLHWHEEVDAQWKGLGGPSLFLPAVSQYQAKRKEDAEKTVQLVSSQEYLALRLGAEPHTTLPNGLYRPWYWTSEQLEARSLDASWFPSFVEPGTRVGSMSRSAMEASGLRGPGGGSSPQGADTIPLIASGPDFFMAILGTACIEPGLACDRAGSSEGLNYCADRLPPKAEPAHALRSLPHWVEGFYNISAILPPTGRQFEAFRHSSGQENRRYSEMLADIEAAGFPGGPCCNPLASAGRALVEGLGFMVREGVERLEKASFPVSALRLSGGQARNEVWNQLKADILDLPLVAGPIRDAELAGSAALCLFALGVHGEPGSAARSLWREERVYEPEARRATYYRERWEALRGQEGSSGRSVIRDPNGCEGGVQG